MSKYSKRILVIGLAEATMNLIEPWAEAGYLPAFKSFMERGTFGRLRSKIPMITPQMWGTIVTGLNPGRHGLYDFWQRDSRGVFREVNGSDLKAEPIWQILSDKGIKCGIVNVPCTYPPQRINGFMISGQDAPGAHSSIAEPPELYKKIVSKFGRYHLKDIFPGGRKKADYLTLISEEVRHQTEVLNYLLTDQSWDFFLTFFSATAMAQHYFWQDMQSGDSENPFRNVILDAYKSIDESLAQFMRTAGENTDIFVVSECGAGPLISGVQINTWLEKEGFLVRKKSAEKGGFISRLRILAENGRKAVQNAIPKDLFFWVNQYFKPLKKMIQSYLAFSDILWEKTCVFSRGKEGEIYINLKGRDPHGIVLPHEYETVIEKVKSRLLQLVDPMTGMTAVSQVFRRGELYDGPYLEQAPDLIVCWRDGAYMPTESDEDKDAVFVARRRERMNWPTSGSHRLDGIFFARGPSIKKNNFLEGGSIMDLLPTWLSLMGQDIPAGLEGKVLHDLFRDIPAEDKIKRESLST